MSVELARERKTAFSFQAAHRSAQLDAPLEGVWPGGLGLSSPALCWSLWKRRQALSGQDADARERESAARLRAWFEKEFIA